MCEGDAIDLEVTLSDPDPEVLWLHDGIVLQESMFVTITRADYSRRLSIYPCTKQDAGVYACVLRPGVGPDDDGAGSAGVNKVTVLTIAEVTVNARRKPTPAEKTLEGLRVYQKLAWTLGESVVEHVTWILCVATLVLSCCMYFCRELLQEDFPRVFERKF